MNQTLKWILIALAVLAVLIFVFWEFVPMKTSVEKTSAEKCFDDFNAIFVKEKSTLLYPDFVRDCCAKPITQQASCLDQYGLLD